MTFRQLQTLINLSAQAAAACRDIKELVLLIESSRPVWELAGIAEFLPLDLHKKFDGFREALLMIQRKLIESALNNGCFPKYGKPVKTNDILHK